ncbi:hypothetical protein AB0K21_35405 [Streptosporangium sp. NPDC049248]|uniref:hypothetical protein n=1 Tax=Streptosporangium sp. NPDC049248 TaxID=3155651 RepID=UPI0034240CE2
MRGRWAGKWRERVRGRWVGERSYRIAKCGERGYRTGKCGERGCWMRERRGKALSSWIEGGGVRGRECWMKEW